MFNIKLLKFWTGNDTPHYFHPAVCQAASDWVMTMQTFNGAGDTYGPVEYTTSTDQGQSWSKVQPLTALKSTILDGGVKEGIADVRTFYHEPTKSVIALGCTTYYGAEKCLLENSNFDRQKYSTRPVYAIRNAQGEWSERRELTHSSFATCNDWRAACTQIEILPDGNIIIPIYYAPNQASKASVVATLLCSFDGKNITVDKVGKQVDNGDCTSYLVEPSIVKFAGKFLLTLRTGEQRGYVTVSDDGLSWSNVSSWCWDDGDPLLTTNTQQHWLKLKDKLYLVYTRSADDNQDVMRWRAPLFMAEVDTDKICLKRHTEQVVLPLIRKRNLPYISGNYHVSSITADLATVSDGQLWFRVEKGATPAEDYIAEYDSFVTIAKITP